MLVLIGARLNVQNDNGGTALHLAVFWGHFPVVELLVEEGANMEIKNDRGRTPLDLAGTFLTMIMIIIYLRDLLKQNWIIHLHLLYHVVL